MNDILINLLAEQKPLDKNLLFIFLTAATDIERNPNAIDGGTLARLLNVLAAAEIQEGGPYRSFTDSQDNDIDIAVNISIAYFLFLQKVDLPKLDSLIEKAILSKSFKSRFFANEYPVIYFLAKFYNGKQKQSLIDYLSGSHYQNDLDQKLVTASL